MCQQPWENIPPHAQPAAASILLSPHYDLCNNLVDDALPVSRLHSTFDTFPTFKARQQVCEHRIAEIDKQR